MSHICSWWYLFSGEEWRIAVRSDFKSSNKLKDKLRKLNEPHLEAVLRLIFCCLRLNCNWERFWRIRNREGNLVEGARHSGHKGLFSRKILSQPWTLTKGTHSPAVLCSSPQGWPMKRLIWLSSSQALLLMSPRPWAQPRRWLLSSPLTSFHSRTVSHLLPLFLQLWLGLRTLTKEQCFVFLRLSKQEKLCFSLVE